MMRGSRMTASPLLNRLGRFHPLWPDCAHELAGCEPASDQAVGASPLASRLQHR
jgi:hypothetical protein